MQGIWEKHLTMGRWGFLGASIVLPISIMMGRFGEQVSWQHFALIFLILSSLVLSASGTLWLGGSFMTRKESALVWIVRRMIVVFLVSFLVGLALVFDPKSPPAPQGEWLSPGAIIMIAAVVGLIALRLVVWADERFYL